MRITFAVALSLPPKVSMEALHHTSPIPDPIISWPLISSFMTNMDLCHSRLDMNVLTGVFSVETIRLDLNFFDEYALHMILNFSKEYSVLSPKESFPKTPKNQQ